MALSGTASTEVEETMKRIQSHRGVKGVLICTAEVIIHALAPKPCVNEPSTNSV